MLVFLKKDLVQKLTEKHKRLQQLPGLIDAKQEEIAAAEAAKRDAEELAKKAARLEKIPALVEDAKRRIASVKDTKAYLERGLKNAEAKLEHYVDRQLKAGVNGSDLKRFQDMTTREFLLAAGPGAQLKAQFDSIKNKLARWEQREVPRIPEIEKEIEVLKAEEERLKAELAGVELKDPRTYISQIDQLQHELGQLRTEQERLQAELSEYIAFEVKPAQLNLEV